MKRREFTQSAAVGIGLSPLSQIDVLPDEDDDDESEEEILLRISTERFRELREKGELYRVEAGIWRFVPEEHRE